MTKKPKMKLPKYVMNRANVDWKFRKFSPEIVVYNFGANATTKFCPIVEQLDPCCNFVGKELCTASQPYHIRTKVPSLFLSVF